MEKMMTGSLWLIRRTIPKTGEILWWTGSVNMIEWTEHRGAAITYDDRVRVVKTLRELRKLRSLDGLKLVRLMPPGTRVKELEAALKDVLLESGKSPEEFDSELLDRAESRAWQVLRKGGGRRHANR
jgi:hypothetical protein